MNKEWMMKRNRIIGSLVVGAMFWACSGGDSDSMDLGGGASGDAGVTAVVDLEVAGVSQKGPFVTGSAVAVQELDGITLKQTGKSFKGSIKSDKGDFAIKDINLESQYAILEATGYYRDEVSGKKSSGMVTLRALTDLSSRKTVNINLLTHLEYERVMYLVNKKKMSIADAKAQAEGEVLASFAIAGDFGESEDLNIFKTGDGNAALLAVSVLLQSDVDVAGLTERIGEFSISLAEGGSWDDADTKALIADWACDIDLKGSLSKIRKNVESWKYADTVPAFEKYVTNFWWDNYGLGACTDKRENETKRNINKLSKLYNEYFVCEKGRWHIPGDEPESSSSVTPSGVEGSSSSADVSSSSLYDPFVSSSSSEPEDTIPPLPAELDLFDSTYSFIGYRSFGEGKQEVWFLQAKQESYQSGRDSVASALVKTMGDKEFSFEGVINNDSLDAAWYDTLSYVYSLKKENVLYKISISKERVLGIMFGSDFSFKVKVVVLKDGFEEMPTTDYSSLRFDKLSKEFDFAAEYLSLKSLDAWDDDSLTTVWTAHYETDTAWVQMQTFSTILMDQSKEDAAGDSLEVFRNLLLENGFTYVKSDTVAEKEYDPAKYNHDHIVTKSEIIIRHLYEKETEMAKFEVDVHVGAGMRAASAMAGNTLTKFVYGYSIIIHTQYKKK